MNTEIRNYPHFVIEVLSILLLLYCLSPLLTYRQLTEAQVPVHYDIEGNVERTGNTQELLYLPLLSLFLFAMITLGEKIPKLINIPGKLTANGKEYLQANGWKLMRQTKLIIMFLMAFIVYWTTQIALGKADSMPMWGIWLPFCALMAVLIVFMYKLYNWN